MMKGLLKHYFVPHFHNNFRAKLLHNSTLFLLTLAVLFTGFSSVIVHRANPEVLGIAYSIASEELLTVTNRYRAEHNLPPLTMNPQLAQAAQLKASDMYQKNYWAHFAPDGSTSPWTFIKSSGYDYIYAGENLAKGFTNSEEVVTAWMNSPSHRDNMLSKNYNEIGFAIVPGILQGEDTVLVVEMLGSTQSPLAADAGVSAAEPAPQVQVQNESEEAVPTVAVPEEKEPVFANQPVQVQSNPGVVKAQLPSTDYQKQPLINIESLSRNSTFVLFMSIIAALLLDILIIERKKIPRFVGHNWDHIMLLTLFLIFIIMRNNGGII